MQSEGLIFFSSNSLLCATLLYRKPQKSEIFGAASQDGALPPPIFPFTAVAPPLLFVWCLPFRLVPSFSFFALPPVRAQPSFSFSRPAGEAGSLRYRRSWLPRRGWHIED